MALKSHDPNRKLNDLVGYAYDQKLVDEAFAILLEAKRKKLGYLPKLNATCLVTVDKDKEILEIGGSEPSDLILNQFGLFLAGLCTGNVATSTESMKDSGGTNRTVYLYYNSTTCFYTGVNLGTKIQIGKGAVTDRTDYTIGSAFANAPESGMFWTAAGSYSTGTVTTSGAITAGGSGTISETVLFDYLCYGSAATYANFAFCHDNISPPASFVAGNSITVQYAWSL